MNRRWPEIDTWGLPDAASQPAPSTKLADTKGAPMLSRFGSGFGTRGHMNAKSFFCASLLLLIGVGAKSTQANDLSITGRFVMDSTQTYLVVGYVDPNGLGAEMGLQPGDVVVRVNGRAPANWAALAQLVRRNGGHVFLEVRRRVRMGVAFVEMGGYLRPQGAPINSQYPPMLQHPESPQFQQQPQVPNWQLSPPWGMR